MTIILTIEEVEKHQEIHGEQLVFIDVRNKNGEEAYRKGHIPGAVFLNMKQDVSGQEAFFAEPVQLAQKLSALGITNEAPIILYDEGNHRAAAKAWFALYKIGHQGDLFILNGGFPAWESANYEVSDTPAKRGQVEYVVQPRMDATLNINEVKDRLDDKQSVLIDSRAHERYTGKVEPKYKKAGHIPGAVNYHSKQVFDEDGNWKSTADLKQHFSSLENKDEIIVSCGSGNSACLNAIALKEAGFKNVKLFSGGFSEWIEAGNDVATETEDMEK